MTSWEEVPADDAPDLEAPSRLGVLARALVPGLAAAVLFVLLDRPVAAAAIALVASAVATASALSPSFHRRFQRVLHAVGSGVAAVLSAVLLGFLEVFVFAPISFVLWVFRRDPLRSGPGAATGAAWSAAPNEAASHRPYAVEPEPPPATGGRRVARAVPRVAGFVAIALLLDFGLGLLWNARVGLPEPPAASVNERVAAAIDDTPWMADYLDELRDLRVDFAPFVQTEGARDTDGRYIDIDDGVRQSYEPEGLNPDAPVIWFFGGTNVWGDGQRNEHTIPSEVARLAEEDGHPIRVVNRAQRGDVNFAAVLRFERALANAEEPPDLVVFADGPDDYLVQRQAPSPNPGQYGLAVAQAEVIRRDERSLWQRYSDASLLHRAVRRIQVLFSVQAAAADELQVPPPDDSLDDELAADLASVYERGRQLAVEIAARHDVPVRFYWLPIEDGDEVRGEYGAAAGAIDSSVTYLDGAFDDTGDSVYLDGVHTDERGARAVAESMYGTLGAELEDLRR